MLHGDRLCNLINENPEIMFIYFFYVNKCIGKRVWSNFLIVVNDAPMKENWWVEYQQARCAIQTRLLIMHGGVKLTCARTVNEGDESRRSTGDLWSVEIWGGTLWVSVCIARDLISYTGEPFVYLDEDVEPERQWMWMFALLIYNKCSFLCSLQSVATLLPSFTKLEWHTAACQIAHISYESHHFSNQISSYTIYILVIPWMRSHNCYHICFAKTTRPLYRHECTAEGSLWY